MATIAGRHLDAGNGGDVEAPNSSGAMCGGLGRRVAARYRSAASTGRSPSHRSQAGRASSAHWRIDPDGANLDTIVAEKAFHGLHRQRHGRPAGDSTGRREVQGGRDRDRSTRSARAAAAPARQRCRRLRVSSGKTVSRNAMVSVSMIIRSTKDTSQKDAVLEARHQDQGDKMNDSEAARPGRRRTISQVIEQAPGENEGRPADFRPRFVAVNKMRRNAKARSRR